MQKPSRFQYSFAVKDLGLMLSDQGKHGQAEKMDRQILGLMETVLDKEHPETLVSMNNLQVC